MKYIHTNKVHNLKAPKIIVKELLKYFKPKSVIDVWCGLWTFVKVFQDNNIKAIWIDGSRVKKSKLYINRNSFIEKDLEKEIDFKKKYDLAISLEVAEHLSKNTAENFVKTLVSCSDYIIFSAAIPWQWWFKHINEQFPCYWENLFNKHWYKFYDVFRHIFWNNPNIYWRYKQNMFLVVKKWKKIPNKLIEKTPRNIIHPELFKSSNINSKNIWKISMYLLYRFYNKIKKIRT